MATTGIIIYEDDRYILKALSERLKAKIPDSYISDGRNEEHTKDIIRLCDESFVIYDSRQYGKEFDGRSDSIAIFRDGFVDTKKIVKTIRITPLVHPMLPRRGNVTLLVPFAYMEERERFIRSELSDLLDCESCIRIDLVTGLKSPDRPSGALESLMDNAARKRFKSTGIMDYCALNDDGFFTPGPLQFEHDPNSYKTDTYVGLMDKISHLVKEYGRSINALIVAEHLRMDILTALAARADRIVVLLPDNRSMDHEGIKTLISGLSRAAQGIDVEIRTIEDLNDEDQNRERSYG